MEDQGSGADPTETGPAPSRGEPAERQALLAAMLEVAGEHGYREATATAVAARAGVDIGRFDLHFSSPAECFAAAYEMAVGPREIALGALAAEASGPEAAASAALTYLAAFLTRQPAQGRAVLVEVYVAGGAALAVHQEVLERLSRAVADACRETHPSRHDPPPTAAAFIVGGIEESLRRRLAERREELLWEDLPELTAILLGACGD
jgi:AcrR family transcriptional regulator